MKHKDIELTVGELETLCNLYIECKLSVLEETELYYVLLKTDKDSDLINETRAIMGIERKNADCKPPIVSKKPFYKRFVFYCAAAVVLAVIILAVWAFKLNVTSSENSPLLTQDVPEKVSVNPVQEFPVHIENRHQEQNGKDTGHPKLNNKQSKPKKNSLSPSKLELQSKQTAAGPDIKDEYIEITDEGEAIRILQEINDKLTAALQKGREANEKIYDINETTRNVLNKI